MKFRFNNYFKKIIAHKHHQLFIIGGVLLVFIALLLSLKSFYQYSPSSPIATDAPNEKIVTKPGLPKQLIIPSINIDVNIDYVGLKSDGSMDIKPNPKVVGWYMLGPRPGDKGNAVIAGHYGWDEKGEPAIFNNIHKLIKGDEVLVIDQKGQSITFVVTEMRKYNPDSDASAVFKSSDGNSHLNLITCEGVWENDKQSYSSRLVIFADIKKQV